MARKLSRRAALGVLGTGLAAVTGVSTRQADCRGTSDCENAIALDGPGSVTPSEGNPRFRLSSDRSGTVRFVPDSWAVYRAGEEWHHLASGDAGRPVTLEGDSTVSYLLLVEAARSGPSVTTAETTTTRYVGPVSLNPGRYAFVVTGRRDDHRTSVSARFSVID